MKSRLARQQREQDRRPAAEWYRGLKTQEEKDEQTAYLRNSSRLFDQLKEMIQRKYDAASHMEESEYDAGWPYKQAHRLGKLEALEDIYKLLP